MQREKISLFSADCWHAMVQDITERKRAQQKILTQNRLLKAINQVFKEALTCETELEVGQVCLIMAQELTSSAFGLIGEVNPDGLFDTIAISNPGWDACKMPDSEATQLIQGMEIRGIDRSTIRDETSRIVNDPSSHPESVGIPKGHPPITSFLGVPLKHAGKTMGMIGLANKESGYDLADQQAIEELSVAFVEAFMRRRAEQAFQTEKEKFRVLVEESPLGVSIIGEDGVYKYINPRFLEIFGYTLKDIPDGREWFRKAHPDPEYRTQVISKWNIALKKAKQSESQPYTFPVICKDGSKKVIQFIAVTMETGGQFVIYEDLTEQKKLEDQFRQSQKMEGIGRLASGVAHDFNNLLTTIMGYADLALMSLAEDDPLRGNLEEIKGGGERAVSLTRQLLAFSRKQILQPVVLDLNGVITGFVKMLERLIGEDVELETVLASELKRVEADPGQMEQIIMNLVINARDAMPEGGKLTIETANVDLDEAYARHHGIELGPGPYVMLGVTDAGTGMDDKTKSLIFEPFFTTKEVGKGTGLGLSTVYGIVKQSGGYIWVYSEPGEGTTFKVYLPAVEKEATQAQKEQTSPDDLTGSETILIVEDDDALRKLACKILEPQGYSILEAQNGIEALKVSEEHGDQIHLMITDAVMPQMGGRELAERLRPLRPDLKVIYMSGYTDNAILHHGVLSPEIEFLEKPFTPARLKRKVREVLDQ